MKTLNTRSPKHANTAFYQRHLSFTKTDKSILVSRLQVKNFLFLPKYYTKKHISLLNTHIFLLKFSSFRFSLVPLHRMNDQEKRVQNFLSALNFFHLDSVSIFWVFAWIHLSKLILELVVKFNMQAMEITTLWFCLSVRKHSRICSAFVAGLTGRELWNYFWEE